jgi:hypothetical protein
MTIWPILQPRRFVHDLARGFMRDVDHQLFPCRRVGDQVVVVLDWSADNGDDLERHLPSSLIRDRQRGRITSLPPVTR